MRFFISGEIHVSIEEGWRSTARPLEDLLNSRCGGREYGVAVRELGMIPIVLPEEFRRGRPERRLFQRKTASADDRTTMDYEQFETGDLNARTRLVVANIIAAVRDLQRKAGARQFEGEQLVADILAAVNLSEAEPGA